MTEALQVALSLFMNLLDIWPLYCITTTDLLSSSSDLTYACDKLTEINFDNVLLMIGLYTHGGFWLSSKDFFTLLIPSWNAFHKKWW